MADEPDELKDVNITQDMVETKLNKLNPTKSPGLDIYPSTLKETANVISLPPSKLFKTVFLEVKYHCFGVDNGYPVELDFSKAFDSVSHRRLLAK